MSDVEIGGNVYRCLKLATPVQWHVYRRLLPVFQGLGPMLSMASFAQGQPDFANIPMIAAVTALANTIGQLNDTDADFVKDACLDAVRWQQGPNWMPLRAPGGAMLNGAADAFDVQLRLVWEVLRESLENFSVETVFPFLRSNGAMDPNMMSSNSTMGRNFSGDP